MSTVRYAGTNTDSLRNPFGSGELISFAPLVVTDDNIGAEDNEGVRGKIEDLVGSSDNFLVGLTLDPQTAPSNTISGFIGLNTLGADGNQAGSKFTLTVPFSSNTTTPAFIGVKVGDANPPAGDGFLRPPVGTAGTNGTAKVAITLDDGFTYNVNLTPTPGSTDTNGNVIQPSCVCNCECDVQSSLQTKEDDAETQAAPLQGSHHMSLKRGRATFAVTDNEGNTTRIIIKSQTDHYCGRNMAQSIMSVYYSNSAKQPKQLNRYFLKRFTEFVVDNNTYGNCTLLTKAAGISGKNKKDKSTLNYVGRISAYGLLRYFLWYLITGVETLYILLDKYTQLFFAVLANSEYAMFLIPFNTPELSGVNVYFKYDLVLETKKVEVLEASKPLAESVC